jgi:hypothetical protein
MLDRIPHHDNQRPRSTPFGVDENSQSGTSFPEGGTSLENHQANDGG